MLIEERLEKILERLNANNMVRISDITESLGVTEMTVRRDFNILEERGQIIRIHGGAKKKQEFLSTELSHNQKRKIHVEEKRYIANIAANMIKENDIIYIGPGTTNELIYDYLNVSYAKIITNSMSIFSKFKYDKRFDLILIGGRFRLRTDVFVGNFTNELLEKIRVKAAFVGVNGIHGESISTSNEEEGVCQRIILNNSKERYVLCDSSKIDIEDFYSFYNLSDITSVITDKNIDINHKEKYEKIVKIITE